MKNLRCLYVHDHIFKKYGSCYFSEGKITDEVFLRYIRNHDELSVFSRAKVVENIDGLNRITLNTVNFYPVKGTDFKLIFSIFFFHNLILCLKNIIYCNFIVVRLPCFLGIFVLFINLFFQKKYFIELVGDPEDSLIMAKDNKKLGYKFFVKMFAKLNAYFIRNSDGVIYVTKYNLQNKYPTKSFQSYASNVEINVCNRKLHQDNYEKKGQVFKIGLIGSFNNSYKGIDIAIDAIRLLKIKGVKANLHILGSGNLKFHYIELAKNYGIEENIIFDGSLPKEKINHWLDTLDLYIQPSRTEGLPRALIEAMARALPVVATEVGGIPELLDQDILVPANNSKILAQKMKEFLDSKQLRYIHGSKNLVTALDYDSQELDVRRTEFWKHARSCVN